MTDSNYEIRKAEQRDFLPEINLLPVIEHKGSKLDVAVFGPGSYKNNLNSMNKKYFHSKQLQNICFRPASTSESISVAAHGFGSKKEIDFKRDIFDSNWLQSGPIVKTQDGVYINTTLTDEGSLKQLLNNAEKVNGIYLLDGGVAFAPYQSFETGVQDCDTFAQGGLARALEHTREKIAPKLRKIASPKLYKEGVNVWGFDAVKEPIQSVASLNSNRNLVGDRLHVDGDDWDGYDYGHAFGVCTPEKR